MPRDIKNQELGPITIVTYNDKWPFYYKSERLRLVGLSEGRITNIEHFGSTSIPGLSAKNTIDIMASVENLDGFSSVVPRLTGGGYSELSENFSRRRFFIKTTFKSHPSFHLHVVTEEAWQNKSERLFRDWLLAHPNTAQKYERLKMDLASRFSDDRESYTEAKSEFIRGVVNDARQAIGLDTLVDWEE